MKWLRFILSMVVLVTGITVRGQYNPENPPEPGSRYTLHLRVYPDDSGSFSPSSGTSYEPGAEVNVRARANTNFRFLHWEDDEGTIVSTLSDFQYTMPLRDATLTARFSYEPASPDEPSEPDIKGRSKLYVTVSPADAGTLNVDSELTVEVGSRTTLRAYNNTGFVFSDWTKDGVSLSSSSTYDYTATEDDAHIVANFVYSPDTPADPPVGIVSHRVYLDCDPTGACTFNRDNGYRVLEGDEVSVHAYVNDYYHLINWTCDDEPIDGGTDLRIKMPDHDIHLTAHFTYDYAPTVPGEPSSAENMAAVYGLTDYVAVKERHLYPIYLDNTLHKAKGMVIDVQFPEGFDVEIDSIRKTRISETHDISYEVVGENNYRITTLGTENTLEKVTAIAMFIPVNIPATAQIDSTYFVRVHYGVLTNMDDSQTPLKTHNGGLRIMEEGVCRITTSLSPYGTIEGGGKYLIGDQVRLVARGYPGYEFVEWTDGTTANPYVFEAKESIVIGAVFREIGFAMSYDGRHVSISAEPGATVYYTIDGSEPTTESEVYAEPFDTGGIADVTAFAVNENGSVSETVTLHTPVYFDGEVATVDVPGYLADGFGWTSPALYADLVVRGQLNAADIRFAARMGALEMLDLGESELTELPADGFGPLRARHLIAPRMMPEGDTALFGNCRRLAAVEWRSAQALTDAAMAGCPNPNMLVYVDSPALAPQNWSNVVIDSAAESITLTDGGDFYCPREFVAAHISYAHHYGKTSAIDGLTAGWEALALPFDVQTVEHESAGVIMPFAANDDYQSTRPYWLEAFGEDGFVPASEIHANTPYLICMPNNPVYSPAYNLVGEVTFRSDSVSVPVSSAIISQGRGYDFVPTTVAVAQADTVALINHEYIATEDCQPGQVFVAGERDAAPFEAYITRGSEPIVGPLHVVGLMRDVTGIVDTMRPGTDIKVYTEDGAIHIVTDIEQQIGVYTVDGILVHIVAATAGDNVIRHLPRGIYIVAGTKVIL